MSSLELFEADWKAIWGTNVPEEVGAVFTRPEVVGLILNLAGYTPSAGRLAERTLLEPSCGDGVFLDQVLDRLTESEKVHTDRLDWEDEVLDRAVCAADISTSALKSARALILTKLTSLGCRTTRAEDLASKWTLRTDFLLHSWDRRFAFVVGNPPYVRLEDLPRQVLMRYRERFVTATDRADLYIPFFEASLQLLDDDGVLAFICANRFARNQYGAALRRLMASRFHVRHYVNLEHTQPFQADVSAYPAIIVVDRKQGTPTLATTLSDCSIPTLDAVSVQAKTEGRGPGPLSLFQTWYPDGSPWRTTSAEAASVLDHLEATFPALEDSGTDTRVGIGVATGADGVYVLQAKNPEIEESRQIPLAMAQDVRSNTVRWSGHFLINPFAPQDDGSLVPLEAFPGLKAYLESSRLELGNRHVAKSRPTSWYRTIDRIWPSLQHRPKLLIPDIQPGGIVALDEGELYPHHNLYWITSGSWDLRALQALLRSSFVLLQVRSLSVEMRGGSLRYQAQTLRRLRLPHVAELPADCVSALVAVATSSDQARIDSAATQAYGFELTRA